MICSTSWHLASLLQLSDGNASTALHLVIGNAMRCWARGRHKFSPCFKPTSYNNKQPRFFMRCSFGHIYGAVTTRVVNLGGRCAPTNAFRAATAVFSSSGMHWVSSVLAWRAFPPAGVLQNAKVLACVQGGPCNHGLDQKPRSQIRDQVRVLAVICPGLMALGAPMYHPAAPTGSPYTQDQMRVASSPNK